MGGARVPTRSGFSETIPAFNVEDSALSRLTNNIKSALQPLLDVFTGSPESAKIRWGKGVPTVTVPVGSVHFQTDPSTTAASALFIKTVPTTSVWSPVPGALGNMLYCSKGTDVPNVSTSWAITSATGGSATLIYMPASSGSILALVGYTISVGAFASLKQAIASGTITAKLYLNSQPVEKTLITLDSTHAFVIVYLNPGTVTFKPGDLLEVRTSGTNAVSGVTTMQMIFTLWGG